ncbi:SusD/RagB family nutrient-binding outer membrane lipoprotein [uncultured Porphyromonas sp.]|uniref:SusD/RagB family nutrient-binding outer membrane lipoprotein n=1 Tax=uncultured Porphyromonas sp. TaxID=159274 RepID=UPI002623494E|nr:SusD/RagB family nutrient-binding outer membrane lipoprotein [uncultured Porphyromonas sp.]
MKLKNLAIFPVLALGALISSCNQEEINTSRTGVTDKELNQGGLSYGLPLMDLQRTVMPIGPAGDVGPGNSMQVLELISTGNYIGYYSNNNNWNFNTEGTWTFTNGRMGLLYGLLYGDVAKSWLPIHTQASRAQDNLQAQQILAIANVVKIVGWLRATDAFGPIVYTKAGSGDITPTPDSQHEVYKGMLAELEKCATLLREAQEPILQRYDLVYNGDASKWVRLANSLMLRMAVRVHFKDAALAQEYITKAVNPANGGLIEATNDEAKIGDSEKQPLAHPALISVNQYNETRMGATIWSYLQGYNDPRLEKYFTQGTYRGRSGYYFLPPTNRESKKEGENTAQYASKPNFQNTTPVYWFRASETYFLMAEAALYGLLSSGTAQEYYEQGVRQSFAEAGAGDATSYLAQMGSTPVATSVANNPYIGRYSDNISSGNVSPSWTDVDPNRNATEVQLQKIITQKYLALFPNAYEAWTEYRRTGYPFIMKPADTGAPSRIGGPASMRAPERFSFPASAYDSNPNLKIIPSLLGGVDLGATRLWWVREDRPNQ